MSRKDKPDDVDISSNLLESESAGTKDLNPSSPSWSSSERPSQLSPKTQIERKTDTPFKPLGALYVRLAQTSSAVKVVRRSIAPAIRDSEHRQEQDPQTALRSLLNLVPSTNLFPSEMPTVNAGPAFRHRIALERRTDSGEEISSSVLAGREGPCEAEDILKRPSLGFQARTSMFANLAPNTSTTGLGRIVC